MLIYPLVCLQPEEQPDLWYKAKPDPMSEDLPEYIHNPKPALTFFYAPYLYLISFYT